MVPVAVEVTAEDTTAGGPTLNPRSVLYNARWQRIRVEMLGTWDSLSSVEQNIITLERYLREVAVFVYSDDAMKQMTPLNWMETANRYYRIINYLNAIRMGYSGLSKTGSKMDAMVEEYRNKLQHQADVYQVYRSNYYVESDKMRRYDLQLLKADDPSIFADIYKDLKKRKGVAVRRHGTASHRSELVAYIELMEEVEKW